MGNKDTEMRSRTGVVTKVLSAFRQNIVSRGSVTVEAAMVLPFIIFSTLSSIELGRSINAYMVISRIAYEGARFAAATPGLSPDQFLNTDCNIALPSCSSALMKVRERVHELMQKSHFQRQNYILQTRVNSVEEISGVSTSMVTITIEADLDNATSLVRYLFPTIRTQITGPYLFPDSHI